VFRRPEQGGVKIVALADFCLAWPVCIMPTGIVLTARVSLYTQPSKKSLGLTGGSKMKIWTKPAVGSVEAGFEVTRYLPSTLDVAAKRTCKK
jgi:coenzyme PQQ precursor peptide PqqA